MQTFTDAQIWAEFSTTPAAYAFATFLGALWGSFGNVCIYRMPPSEAFPKGRSVVKPGSHCFACGHAVRWYDNIPMLSFLWLKGACRDCQASFSPRYLLVEAATAMLFVAAYHYVVVIAYALDSPGDQLIRFGIYAAFVWILVVIAFIDLDHQLILNKLTYPAIPIFYGLGMLLPGATWQRGLIGLAVGYGLIRAIADGYWYLAKREGMGYGDGKLLAIIGALFGWQAVFVSLFAGSILGSVISIALMIAYRRKSPANSGPEQGCEGEANSEADSVVTGIGKRAVPFGPFLAMGAIIYLFSESYLRVEFFILWE